MKRILITGCGRSGTQWIARLLKELHLPVTHEQVYRQDLQPDTFNIKAMEGRWLEKETSIEVSWLAGPFVKQQPDDVFVWHQLRDPLKVVRCWASHGYLNTEAIKTVHPPLAVGAYIHQFLPECSIGTDLQRAVQYVLKWTRLIVRTVDSRIYAERYRVEDLTSEDIWMLLWDVGHHYKLSRIKEAFTEIQPGVGGCNPSQHIELTWKQIEEVAGGKELRELAETYGYDTSSVD